MNQYLQLLIIWIFKILDVILDKWNYVKTEYRKRYGDWQWIDLQTPEPQILHIYFIRPGAIHEHWKAEHYKRWNARLRDKKQIRGSEWYLPQYISKYHGIMIHYRFRQQEWFETCNWLRSVTANKACEPLHLMRCWGFPRWNSETWKSSSGRVKFPSGFSVNKEECDVSEWRSWFGPESRQEQIHIDEEKDEKTIVKRNYEMWFNLVSCQYLINYGDSVQTDWGIREDNYIWGDEDKKEK